MTRSKDNPSAIDRAIALLIDICMLHGPVPLILSIAVFSLLVLNWLFGFGFISLPDFLAQLSEYAVQIVDILGHVFSPLFWIIRKILLLPPPPEHWKVVVVASIFIPLRAVIIEFSLPGRRTTALLTLAYCVVFGVAGAYTLNLGQIPEDSPFVLLLIVIIFALVEFFRNTTLALFRRRDATESFSSALQFYHGINTLPNALIGAFAVLLAFILDRAGLHGGWVLGYLFFLVFHGLNLLLSSIRVQIRITGHYHGWYPSQYNLAKVSAAWVSLDTVKLVFCYVMIAVLASAFG
jgi:hypothetical protein